MKRRWLWIALALALALVLYLPMPIAERFTSPTQQGQYLTSPLRSYRFVIAAATVSPAAKLNASGEALAAAKALFEPHGIRPTKVELLFFPEPQPYSYTSRDGHVLTVPHTGRFVWEVWAPLPSDDTNAGVVDVVGLLDYVSGEVLAGRLPEEQPTESDPGSASSTSRTSFSTGATMRAIPS